MHLKINQAIEYSAIFKEEILNVDYFLESIPSLNIIQIFCWIDSEIYSRENNENKQLELYQKFSERFPKADKDLINQYIINLQRNGDKFSIFTHISNLSIIQYAIENYNTEKARDLSPEEELALFQGYMFLTEKWTSRPNFNDNQASIFSNKRLFLENFMPIQIPTSNLLEVNNFIIQTIKACYLFKFIEKSEKYNKLYEAFLKENNISNWRIYLSNIYSGFIAGFDQRGIAPFRIKIKKEHYHYKKWFLRYAIDVEKFESDDFFRGIREKPIFKLDDENFLFLNQGFFVNKIYQAIIFDLSKAAVKSNVKIGEKAIKNVMDLKPFYAADFTEQIMLYNLMDYIFERKASVRYSGKDLNLRLKKREVDYLIKDGNNIILIECKDSSFSNNAKGSYSEIKKEILKKMASNFEEKPKGTTQLVNAINDILKGKYDFVIRKNKKITIYPVIVFTDYTFNLVGVNHILKTDFRKKINKIEGIKEIKDITLVYMDTLIKFQDLYKEKKISFRKSIDTYQKYLKTHSKKYHNGDLGVFISYDKFIHLKTKDMNYTNPKVFKNEIQEIIEYRESV